MVRVRRQPTRGDLSKRACPDKPARRTRPKDRDYEAYQRWIRSSAFRELRERMLDRDGRRCRFCGRTEEELRTRNLTLQAHHRSYANCGKGNQEELDDLVTLCQYCHKGLHSLRADMGRFSDKSRVIPNLRECHPETLNG